MFRFRPYLYSLLYMFNQMTTVIRVFDVVILLRRDNSNAEIEKLEKIISLVHIASKYVDKYFDICISLNFITNHTGWNGEDAMLFITNSNRAPSPSLDLPAVQPPHPDPRFRSGRTQAGSTQPLRLLAPDRSPGASGPL